MDDGLGKAPGHLYLLEYRCLISSLVVGATLRRLLLSLGRLFSRRRLFTLSFLIVLAVGISGLVPLVACLGIRIFLIFGFLFCLAVKQGLNSFLLDLVLV